MDDFGDFYAAGRDRILRAVAAAGGDWARAEDSVAEAYARAYVHWPRLRKHPNPSGWVLVAALNIHRSWWRRLRRERTQPIPESVELAAPATQDRPLSSELRRVLASLPRRQREVIAMRLLADMSAEQTAQLLGISVATVHVHLHRGLTALRTTLSTEYTQRSGNRHE